MSRPNSTAKKRAIRACMVATTGALRMMQGTARKCWIVSVTVSVSPSFSRASSTTPCGSPRWLVRTCGIRTKSPSERGGGTPTRSTLNTHSKLSVEKEAYV
jgi:hypothetical protein